MIGCGVTVCVVSDVIVSGGRMSVCGMSVSGVCGVSVIVCVCVVQRRGLVHVTILFLFCSA